MIGWLFGFDMLQPGMRERWLECYRSCRPAERLVYGFIAAGLMRRARVRMIRPYRCGG